MSPRPNVRAAPRLVHRSNGGVGFERPLPHPERLQGPARTSDPGVRGIITGLTVFVAAIWFGLALGWATAGAVAAWRHWG